MSVQMEQKDSLDKDNLGDIVFTGNSVDGSDVFSKSNPDEKVVTKDHNNVKDNFIHLLIDENGEVFLDDDPEKDFDKDIIISDLKKILSEGANIPIRIQTKLSSMFGLPSDIFAKLESGELIDKINGVNQATKEQNFEPFINEIGVNEYPADGSQTEQISDKRLIKRSDYSSENSASGGEVDE